MRQLSKNLQNRLALSCDPVPALAQTIETGSAATVATSVGVDLSSISASLNYRQVPD